MQIHPSEAAPRAPEHREPCDPVVEVRERAREAEQVLCKRLLAERVDLHRVEGTPRARRRSRSPTRWLRLCTSTAIDFSGALALGRDDLGDTRASARASAAISPWTSTSSTADAVRVAMLARNAAAPAAIWSTLGNTRANVSLTHATIAGAERKLRSSERLEPNVSDTALLGL
jgi:hypothetical protein